MKVLYKLDTRKQNSDGTYTLKARIYKDRQNVVWISLKIPLTENQWDGKLIVNHDEAKILNARLAHYKINIAQELLNIDMEGTPISMTEVRSRIEKAIGTKASTPSSFHSYFLNHIETIKKPSTKSTFELAFKNVLLYDSSDKGFSEINIGSRLRNRFISYVFE